MGRAKCDGVLNVRIERELLAALTVASVTRGEPVSVVIRRMIREWLSRQERRGAR
jgi:hypothetical protein